MVVGRVLASQQPTADSRITVQAYKLLRNARSAAYRWIQDLEQTLELLSEPDEIQECSQRLLVVSATCRSTYDVDSPHLAQILATETDLRIFIHCAFIIYRHTPARVIDMAPDVQRILFREYRLRHFAHDLVVQRVEEGNLGLDQAVQAIWVGFSRKRSKPWVPVDPSSKCWWVAQVTRQTIVHCNLLDGQFLVNGKTLGKLPKSYMKHSLYQRIFGNVSSIPVTIFCRIFSDCPVEGIRCCAISFALNGFCKSTPISQSSGSYIHLTQIDLVLIPLAIIPSFHLRIVKAS